MNPNMQVTPDHLDPLQILIIAKRLNTCKHLEPAALPGYATTPCIGNKILILKYRAVALVLMIKCILFDLGGVMIDYTDAEYFYPHLSRASGVPTRKVWRMVQNGLEIPLDKGQIAQRDFNRAVAYRLGIKASQVRWYEIYEKNGRLNRGTLNLAKLLGKRYEVSYLSNVDRSRYSWSVRLLKPYLKIFTHRFASFELHMRKPNANIYRYVLRRMGFESGEVVFIDNLPENVRGARRVGIRSILFTSSKDLEKRLRKMGIRF